MRNRSFILAVCLFLTLPLGEIHSIFHVPELRERQWFLVSDTKQDIEWYLKDTEEAITWIVIFAVWYIRESLFAPNSFFKNIVLWFLLYRILDLGMYWINHRHAGLLYTIVVYGSFIATIVYNYNKWRKQ